ncbi:MAG: hypothetical protein GY742_06135 [Hyphomicrobiales bacterium]|nr:hypothetical protein [Hyphomicrobiales bacterium]
MYLGDMYIGQGSQRSPNKNLGADLGRPKNMAKACFSRSLDCVILRLWSLDKSHKWQFSSLYRVHLLCSLQFDLREILEITKKSKQIELHEIAQQLAQTRTPHLYRFSMHMDNTREPSFRITKYWSY